MDLRTSRYTHLETRNPRPERLSLHAYTAGAGDPVLCISGFGCSSYCFEWMWPTMARRSNVVLFEARGMGKSSPVQEDYELEDLAKDAVAVMTDLGHASFHVVGISMGGMIAQLIAVNEPQRVKSLALLCTSSAGERFLPLPPLTPDMLRKAETIPEPQRTELTLRAIVHPKLLEHAPSVFGEIAELRRSNKAPLGQLLLQKAAVDRFLAGPALPLEKIACPTLVLTGDADRFVPPENSRRLAGLIPDTSLKFIPESDHYFFLEKAEEVAATIGDFLQSLSEKKSEVPV